MRTAPLYTMYFNWSRLIVLGIIPFVMLVYLNAKIYKDIQVRLLRMDINYLPSTIYESECDVGKTLTK